MAALKTLVIGMGLLIVAGMGLIAWGLYEKVAGPGFKLFAGDGEAAAPQVPTRPFGRVDLDLPSGCAIVDSRPDGERLYVHIGPPGPCARIVVVDIVQGRVLGTVAVSP